MNVTKRDYYEILGVAREVDTPGLKSAYKKMAMKYHPDRNPNDQESEEKFKEAAEAYRRRMTGMATRVCRALGQIRASIPTRSRISATY